jgi:2-polyprenyl-3-methyl-5-hydroxy-6-metoxy-1,4-benzoquinol methylase
MSLLFQSIKNIAKAQRRIMAYGKELCPVCGTMSLPYDAVDFNRCCEERRGLRLPESGIAVPYFQCLECGFCFAPTIARWSLDEFKEKIYNQDYIKVDPDYAEVRPRDNARLLIDLFGDHHHSIRHLDYGAGNGMVSEILRQHGWRTESYDPLSDRGRPLSGMGRFNLITAFEVFEHVPSPANLMNDIASVIEADGILIFGTLLSDDMLIPDGRLTWWYASPRNGHISLYSSRSLQALSARHQFFLGSFSEGLHCMWRDAQSWALSIVAGNRGIVGK